VYNSAADSVSVVSNAAFQKRFVNFACKQLWIEVMQFGRRARESMISFDRK